MQIDSGVLNVTAKRSGLDVLGHPVGLHLFAGDGVFLRVTSCTIS